MAVYGIGTEVSVTTIAWTGVTHLSYRNMSHVVVHEVSKLINGQPPTIQLNTVRHHVTEAPSIGL